MYTNVLHLSRGIHNFSLLTFFFYCYVSHRCKKFNLSFFSFLSMLHREGGKEGKEDLGRGEGLCTRTNKCMYWRNMRIQPEEFGLFVLSYLFISSFIYLFDSFEVYLPQTGSLEATET